MKQYLREINWPEHLNQTAEKDFSYFHNTLISIYNRVSPEKQKKVTIKTKPEDEAYTEEIRQIVNILDALNVIKTVQGTQEAKRMYRLFKTFLNDKIQEEKRKSIATTINNSQNKQKTIWTIINTGSNKTKKQSNPEMSTLNAEELNTFFSTVGKRAGESGVSGASGASLTFPRQDSSFFLTPVAKEEIKAIIKMLKPKCTQDIHGLNTIVLKKLSEELTEPLWLLINKCFQEGYFPEELKPAVIIPIYKKMTLTTAPIIGLYPYCQLLQKSLRVHSKYVWCLILTTEKFYMENSMVIGLKNQQPQHALR